MIFADTPYGQLAAITGGSADLSYTWDGMLPLSQSWSGGVSGRVGYTWQDGTLWLQSLDINGLAVDYTYDTDGVPTQIGDQALTYQNKSTRLKTRKIGEVGQRIGTRLLAS